MLTFLLALALASIPFAHRSQAAPLQDPSFVAFVQAGGDLSDLCSGSPQDHRPGTSGCEACRLVNAVILPTPVEMLIAPRRSAETKRPLPHARHHSGAPAAAPPPARGPPQL